MNTRTPSNALAQEKAPTVEEEMSRFKGYTTNNGETVDPKSDVTRRGAGDTNLSPEEEQAGGKVINEQDRGAAKGGEAKPVKVELTDDEKTAALDDARKVLQLKDDEELTEEEEAEALAKALTDKKAAAKGGKGGNDRDSRVKRAQEGRRRAEARAARLERELGTISARLAAVEGRGAAPLDSAAKGGKDDGEDKEPQAKDFELGELDPKYIRALARWEVRQELAESSKTQQTKQQKSAQDQAAAEYAEKKAAFEDAGLEAFDDFQEVVMDTVTLPKSDPAAWPLSATVGKLLLDSKYGPHIAYALASDPKEAKRVDKLSPADQQRWFFRQEAKLEAEHPASGEAEGEQEEHEEAPERRPSRTPNQPQARVSKAPPPPARRSNGGNGNRGGVSSATTDFAAFEAMANGKKDR